MKKRRTSSKSAKTEFSTGYLAYGHYHIGGEDLAETSLDSLEILCSGMSGQMRDSDIRDHYRKTGDYDANEMYFNIWVNGFLIQFHFELMGLHVNYNAWDLMRPGHVHTATPAIVSYTIAAAYDWLSEHCIEDISEVFYEVAEQGIAWNIADAFRCGKAVSRGKR